MEITTATNIDGLRRPKLKLTGVDGNAFSIIGAACRALRKAGWTAEQTKQFTKEATSGNYDNVLQACMKYLDVR